MERSTEAQDRSENATVYLLKFVRMSGLHLSPNASGGALHMPPTRLALSKIVTSKPPFCVKVLAATKPAGPAPTMQTVFIFLVRTMLNLLNLGRFVRVSEEQYDERYYEGGYTQ